jgi:5-formyltetrahydrofolate cyclo-ligase
MITSLYHLNRRAPVVAGVTSNDPGNHLINFIHIGLMTEIEPIPASIAEEKAELRRQARAVLSNSAPMSPPNCYRLLADVLIQHDRSADVDVLSLYWPLVGRGEADVSLAMHRLYEAGYTITLPCTRGPDSPLVFLTWKPGMTMTDDWAGIPTPANGDVVDPNILVCPFFMADPYGTRLGHGYGHYDRSLAQLRAKKDDLLTIGFGRAELIRDVIPRADHDEPVDVLLTEEGWQTTNPAGHPSIQQQES